MLATANLPEQDGSFPAIWNVPFQRNPNFVGRESDLTELHQTLAGAEAAGRVRVIYGMAGVGKTSLVAEYVYRRRGDYNLVWWIRADSTSAIAASLAALAPKLGMIGALDEVDIQEVSESVRASWTSAMAGCWFSIMRPIRRISKRSSGAAARARHHYQPKPQLAARGTVGAASTLGSS